MLLSHKNICYLLHSGGGYTMVKQETEERSVEMVDLPEKLSHKEKWRAYLNNPDEQNRNQLVEAYIHLVHYCAERLNKRLPNSVDLEDLKSSGIFGLIDAIEKYDPDKGVKFKTYSTLRIRGSILDSLRSSDWVPRLIRKKTHEYQDAVNELEAELGRRPTNIEIADKLDVSLQEVEELQREISTSVMFSLTPNWNEDSDDLENIDRLQQSTEPAPDRELYKKNLIDYITKDLDKKERLVLLLYYVEDLTMKEIGETLDLSESRICQIHSALISELQEELSDQKEKLLGQIS